MISPRRPRVPLLAAGALGILGTLGLAGCGEIVEPEPFTLAASTSIPSPESGASSVEAPTAEVSNDPLVPSDFVPSRPDDYLAEILISTQQGILSASPNGLVRPLAAPFAGLSTSRAVDDLLGGLVYEQGTSGVVVWLPAQGERQELLDGDTARLLDVGYNEGSPTAVMLVGETEIEQLRLADGQRLPLVTLGDDEEVLALSTIGVLHALAVSDEQCGGIRFYDADGTPVDLDGPEPIACPIPRRPSYGSVALSPDGGAMVYTVVTYRDDGVEVSTELVARELATGSDYYQTTVGTEGDKITDLSFDGGRVAFVRETAEGTSVALLDLAAPAAEVPIDLQSAAATPVDSISFARLPLAAG